MHMHKRFALTIGGFIVAGAMVIPAGSAFAGVNQPSAACTQIVANFNRNFNLIEGSTSLTRAQKNTHEAALSKAEAAALKANNCNVCTK
ncbi:MAG: hypothetical protein QOF20_1013 [Acidimicrobiaceae bacterium]|jgi:ABC-type transport system involved in cytochrome bd biosynthesis fused ATPase/permease subunit|nr:hypothetical protein [Acidimicrobiaceae bacterium]MDQ1419261.1 hypothetical protein [Acidimicrobiaceae bacterium]MDQ1443349.1 hypothetical protein [Acidimicrobiaceae bacterium]